MVIYSCRALSSRWLCRRYTELRPALRAIYGQLPGGSFQDGQWTIVAKRRFAKFQVQITKSQICPVDKAVHDSASTPICRFTVLHSFAWSTECAIQQICQKARWLKFTDLHFPNLFWQTECPIEYDKQIFAFLLTKRKVQICKSAIWPSLADLPNCS